MKRLRQQTLFSFFPNPSNPSKQRKRQPTTANVASYTNRLSALDLYQLPQPPVSIRSGTGTGIETDEEDDLCILESISTGVPRAASSPEVVLISDHPSDEDDLVFLPQRPTSASHMPPASHEIHSATSIKPITVVLDGHDEDSEDDLILPPPPSPSSPLDHSLMLVSPLARSETPVLICHPVDVPIHEGPDTTADSMDSDLLISHPSVANVTENVSNVSSGLFTEPSLIPDVPQAVDTTSAKTVIVDQPADETVASVVASVETTDTAAQQHSDAVPSVAEEMVVTELTVETEISSTAAETVANGSVPLLVNVHADVECLSMNQIWRDAMRKLRTGPLADVEWREWQEPAMDKLLHYLNTNSSQQSSVCWLEGPRNVGKTLIVSQCLRHTRPNNQLYIIGPNYYYSTEAFEQQMGQLYRRDRIHDIILCQFHTIPEHISLNVLRKLATLKAGGLRCRVFICARFCPPHLSLLRSSCFMIKVDGPPLESSQITKARTVIGEVVLRSPFDLSTATGSDPMSWQSDIWSYWQQTMNRYALGGVLHTLHKHYITHVDSVQQACTVVHYLARSEASERSAEFASERCILPFRSRQHLSFSTIVGCQQFAWQQGIRSAENDTVVTISLGGSANIAPVVNSNRALLHRIHALTQHPQLVANCLLTDEIVQVLWLVLRHLFRTGGIRDVVLPLLRWLSVQRDQVGLLNSYFLPGHDKLSNLDMMAAIIDVKKWC